MPERENRHFDHQRMVPHLCCEVPDNGSVSRKGNNRSPIDSSYDIICIEQYLFFVEAASYLSDRLAFYLA